MSRSKDPLALSPHWHVDYRIEAELPEDTIVGKRFLINVAFTLPALVALVFFCVGAFERSDLKGLKEGLDKRIGENRVKWAEIERMDREYRLESPKIEQAYALVGPQLFVSEFVASLGRTRKEQMAIDLIEWNDAGIVLRGGLRERSEQATRILRNYLEDLRYDPQIGVLFDSIKLTDVDRGTGGGLLRFEIKFVLKERK